MVAWLTLVAVALDSRPAAAASIRVWTGSGTDQRWSNPTNWSDGVPENGDTVLLLRHPLGFPVSAVNDLTNLSLATVRCEAIGYNLSGGTLRLTGEVLMGGPLPGANMNISAPVEIAGPTLAVVSTNSSELTLSGVVTAGAGTVVTVDGGLRYRASGASDFRAELRLRSGFLPLLSTRLRGPLVVGGGDLGATLVLQSGNLFAEFPPISIQTNGSLINVSTLNNVGALDVSGGSLRLGGRSPQGDINIAGDARLGDGARVFVSSINALGPGSLNVTGQVTIAGCSLVFDPGAGTILNPGVIIRNDGVDAVSGIFAGLPEQSVLTNGPMRYVISYQGGDGNDITLSPVIDPPRLENSVITGGERRFRVQGQAGFTYVVETATSLGSTGGTTDWVPVRTNGAAADGSFTFSEPESGPGPDPVPARFYRVVKP